MTTTRRITALIGLLTVVLLAAACTNSGSSRPAASASGATASAGTGSSRPNFVFVLTDDLAWNLVSHMPHVEALQKAGTTLSHYYVVDSLCCPSRSAIFTGEYPHDDGVFTNSGSDGGYATYDAHGDQQKSFALALQKSGYRTAMMGKYLNGYQPSDPIPPGWNEWDVAGNGYPEFNYTLNEDGKQVRYGHSPDDYLTDVLSGKASTFIGSAASSGKPFMLEVATFAPHAPYTPAPKYAHAAQTVAYPKTPAYDTLPSDPPSWLEQRGPLTTAEQERILKAYRKRVEADLSVDDMIGHLEDELKAKGLARNTYFIFSSDNGYHMGEYRLLPGKQTAYDTDIHVPLIVSGPGVPGGHAATQLASNIDLAPTLESLAGLPVASTVDGHSLADVWHGESPAGWRQAILIEHHGPDDTPGDPDAQNKQHADPPSYEAVRTAGALYVKYSNGDQEYYDTATDPYELHNLAARGVPASLPRALTAMENCHTAAACWTAAHLLS
ncbi:MAG TPA: sulfatase [Streptosporangiaceae bacterium]|nr:sulfatase [Streptosporangiaceae bacterium]